MKRLDPEHHSKFARAWRLGSAAPKLTALVAVSPGRKPTPSRRKTHTIKILNCFFFLGGWLRKFDSVQRSQQSQSTHGQGNENRIGPLMVNVSLRTSRGRKTASANCFSYPRNSCAY